MLCLMHQGDPYGHLRTDGQDISESELARIAGIDKRTLLKLISELEKRRVFSRTTEGTVYSRRMVNDEKVRLARAKGGFEASKNPNVPKKKDTLEGHPSSDPQRTSTRTPKRTSSDPSYSRAGASPSPSPYISNQSTSLQQHTCEQAWIDFLGSYPERNTELDTDRAKKIFETLASDGLDLEIVARQIKAYRRYCESEGNIGTKFVKQMSGWLNEGYWNKNWETKADQREPETETYRDLTEKDIEDIHR